MNAFALSAAGILGGAAVGWVTDGWVACSLGERPTARTRTLTAVACGVLWVAILLGGIPILGDVRSLGAVAWMGFVWGTVVLVDYDLRARVLPEVLTVPLLLTGIVFREGSGQLVGSAVGAMGLFTILGAIRLLAMWVYRDEVFGFGDVMFGAALGAWLTWPIAGWGLLAAFVAGGAVGAGLMIVRVAQRRWRWGTEMLPFGPFLAAGALAVVAASRTGWLP